MIKNISNAIDNPLAGAHPFKCLFGIGIILVHFSILVGAAVAKFMGFSVDLR